MSNLLEKKCFNCDIPVMCEPDEPPVCQHCKKRAEIEAEAFKRARTKEKTISQKLQEAISLLVDIKKRL